MNESTSTLKPAKDTTIFDLVVIGGGINGCGIARDAAGRGLSVLLCEKGDLAEATSSASTKLFHGGLRYLEYFEFRLVRKALREREVLLKAMPHIAWPMRFVLPYDPEMRYPDDASPLAKMLRTFLPFFRGRRPAWLVRAGLFIYDHLGGRDLLPATRTVDLRKDAVGRPLKPKFKKAFEYSDCWVNDSRLVVLNARDAADKGADIRTRTLCTGAERSGQHWRVHLKNTEQGGTSTVVAKGIVNAGGPWVDDILNERLRQNASSKIRLVRGSHIVTRRLFDHEQPYFFQLPDGRIIFAIPYERHFTLIGTTDHDHEGDPGKVSCTPEEQEYLLSAANQYFEKQLTNDDVVWTFSGVRPLYDDNASSATSATRDYVLTLGNSDGKAPLLNVFGGKITTYRKLAEEALLELTPYYPKMSGKWTAEAPLPGGDFPVDGVEKLVSELITKFPFLTSDWAIRMVRSYGTLASDVYGDAKTKTDLGRDFGATLFQREVSWLVEKEWAITAKDVVWRRTKLGLEMSKEQIEALEESLVHTSTNPIELTAGS